MSGSALRARRLQRGDFHPECWLARFDPKQAPCDGPIDRAHLIPKSRIRKRLREGGVTDLRMQGIIVWSPASFVCACRYHHGQFDVAKTVRVPRSEIPAETESYAELLGLTWSLDHDYGRRDEAVDPLPRPPESDDDEGRLGGGPGPDRP